MKHFLRKTLQFSVKFSEDLLVIDSDGLPLGYAQIDSVLSVYSLGTSEIEITYLTQDLTSKEGRYWTLQMISPTTTHIALPSEAAIISLNKVPEMIENLKPAGNTAHGQLLNSGNIRNRHNRNRRNTHKKS